MRKLWTVLALAAVLLLACGRTPLEGGTRIADDVYWRLNMLGDGEQPPAMVDSVRVCVRVARPGASPGSVFSTERWYGMGDNLGTTFFFKRLCQGDSATVLMRSPRVPWTALGATAPALAADTGWMQMELSMLEIRTPEQSRELIRAALMARTQADEERILHEFFERDTLPWKQSMGVWYRLDSLAEKGPRIQSGDVVTFLYTASFLDNGKVFDEQTERDGGLTFRLGDPGQVIKGLEVAAHLLPAAGGGGTFVIPAELAFGARGSSSGIIPPWTPVMYRVTAVERRPA